MGFLIDFMSKIKHLLCAIATVLPVLALCSFSPPSLAVDMSSIGTGRFAPFVGVNIHGSQCKGSMIPYGPYDYLEWRDYKKQLFIVEEYHLTPEILNLQQATTTSAIKDIQYTLMAWPNHPKALWAAYRYRRLHPGDWKQGVYTATPVECHLQRAMKFSPRDPIPYAMHGLVMHEFGHYKEAVKSYRAAHKLNPNDLISEYNMGLSLVKLGRYDEADELVEKIYSTDFPLQGLKNMLARAREQDAEAAKIAAEALMEEPTEEPA
jgi:tetratricopeptide (TPR) repeat protein